MQPKVLEEEEDVKVKGRSLRWCLLPTVEVDALELTRTPRACAVARAAASLKGAATETTEAI